MRSVFDLKDNQKLNALICHLQALESVALAYSNGVDSTFLLKAAHDVLGERCVAVTAVSPAFPCQDKQEAADFCAQNQIPFLPFSSRELELEEYRSNPPNRCYYCKRHLFQSIQSIAEKYGLNAVIEGSNVDDLGDYRPGLQALSELGIVSPLREAGLSKQEIRELSRALGLPTWDKPSFACLASRVPYGEAITLEKLDRIRKGEELLAELGLRQYRVRVHEKLARIEIEPEQFQLLLEHREQLNERFRGLGFSYVTLDLLGFRSGSLNEVLEEKRSTDGTT